MPQDVVGRGNISFGKNKDEMSGNKGKQRRWGVDKHPVFAVQKTDILTGIKVRLEIFRMDILKMWYVSLFHGMNISFYRVKQNISQLIV